MNNETSNRREKMLPSHGQVRKVSQIGNISNGRKINIKACLKLDSSPFMITLEKNMTLKKENLNSKKIILFHEFSLK